MNRLQNHIGTQFFLVLAFAAAGVLSLCAQEKDIRGVDVQSASDIRRQWVRSTTSDIEFNASNYGIFGVNLGRGRSGFVYPRSSGISYMFGSGLWFGTKKKVDGVPTKLFFTTFNPLSGESWATPGERGDSSAPAPLYNSIDYNRDGNYFRAPVPAGMAHWPMWLTPGALRPYALDPGTFVVDTLQRTTSTGNYSRPAFFEKPVEELMVSRFNDGSIGAYELTDSLVSRVYPLGLQFQQNVYSGRGGQLLSNVVLVQYQIVNTSRDTLFDCVVAQASDPDIGISSNDHLRFYSQRPELRTGYAWSTQESQSYGALAMALIEAPVVDGNGFVNNRRRWEYKFSGQIGSFPYWPRSKDFSTLADRYDFMTTPTFAADEDEDDQLALMASNTFSMRPGDTAHFAVAYVVLDEVPKPGRTQGTGTTRASARADETTSQMELAVASLLEFYYYTGGLPSGVEALDAEVSSPAVYPNPARETARISFNGSVSGTHMSVTDALGRDVMERDVDVAVAGRQEMELDCRGLAPGLYFVRLRTDRGTSVAPLVIAQ